MRFRSLVLSVLVIIGVAILVVSAANTALTQLTQSIIKAQAAEKATSWAQDFLRAVPGLEHAPEQGVTPYQQTLIAAAQASMGDVFRFILFDMQGGAVYISDAYIDGTDPEAGNLDAQAAIRTLKPRVYLKDGRAKDLRPDDYVEAYVPVRGAHGHVFGAIEVYVDVSATAAILKRSFTGLTLVIVLICMVLFLIPSGIVMQRTHMLHQKDRKLLELSRFDALTRVLNRGVFSSDVRRMFEDMRDMDQSIGLFFVDLDWFKQVNDAHGHKCGDALLAHIAHLLQASCRPIDLVGRIGGDEFAIAMPEIDENDLLEIGARIEDALRAPFLFGSVSLRPSLSIGAHLSPPQQGYTEALNCADVAVYEAKARGRGQIVVFSEELQTALKRKKFVFQAVATGLKRGGFYLNYQPLFAEAGARLVGFEALLRLHAQDGTRISPEEFIPVAERAGLIEDIGAWTLRTALRAAADWPREIFVAVNLSADQFKSGHLCEIVAEALALSGVAPDRLELEVTESLLIEDEEAVGRQITALKSAGIPLALDDFGTGYSSLGYLWKFHFSKLKVDRVFVEALDYDPVRYRKILATIVMLAEALDMRVTVEGIETPDQLRTVSNMGPVLLQGFLLGKPISDAAAVILCQDHAAGLRPAQDSPAQDSAVRAASASGTTV